MNSSLSGWGLGTVINVDKEGVAKAGEGRRLCLLGRVFL